MGARRPNRDKPGPIVALTIPSAADFVSARLGNYQYSFQDSAVLPDQFWVR